MSQQNPAPAAEMGREYRVLKQTLSMHTMLRDRYVSLSLLVDLALLLGALVLCAATFVGEDILLGVGVTPQTSKYVLGGASVVVLFASLVELRAGWKAKADRHHKAADELTEVLAAFRAARQEDDSWPATSAENLRSLYWNAMRRVEPIPSRLFNKLKARHLRKVQVSKALDACPGCPLFVLWVRVLVAGLLESSRGRKGK